MMGNYRMGDVMRYDDPLGDVFFSRIATLSPDEPHRP
jgi:hypothetical protein